MWAETIVDFCRPHYALEYGSKPTAISTMFYLKENEAVLLAMLKDTRRVYNEMAEELQQSRDAYSVLEQRVKELESTGGRTSQWIAQLPPEVFIVFHTEAIPGQISQLLTPVDCVGTVDEKQTEVEVDNQRLTAIETLTEISLKAQPAAQPMT